MLKGNRAGPLYPFTFDLDTVTGSSQVKMTYSFRRSAKILSIWHLTRPFFKIIQRYGRPICPSTIIILLPYLKFLWICLIFLICRPSFSTISRSRRFQELNVFVAKFWSILDNSVIIVFQTPSKLQKFLWKSRLLCWPNPKKSKELASCKLTGMSDFLMVLIQCNFFTSLA